MSRYTGDMCNITLFLTNRRGLRQFVGGRFQHRDSYLAVSNTIRHPIHQWGVRFYFSAYIGTGEGSSVLVDGESGTDIHRGNDKPNLSRIPSGKAVTKSGRNGIVSIRASIVTYFRVG